jgi:hypothetical protein
MQETASAVVDKLNKLSNAQWLFVGLAVGVVLLGGVAVSGSIAEGADTPAQSVNEPAGWADGTVTVEPVDGNSETVVIENPTDQELSYTNTGGLFTNNQTVPPNTTLYTVAGDTDNITFNEDGVVIVTG